MLESIVGDWQAIAQTEPYVTNELVEDKRVQHDNDSWLGGLMNELVEDKQVQGDNWMDGWG